MRTKTMEPRQCKARTSHGNGDRLSDLPLDIQAKILSFLPIKEAVRTSVFSQRWRYVWLSLPTFDLDLTGDDEEEEEESTYKKRSIIIDRLLSRLRAASIGKCRFVGGRFPKRSAKRIIKWFSIIKTRGVTDLYISRSDFALPGLLPHVQGFHCLSSLSLVSCVLTCPETGCSFQLGTLKRLEIRYLYSCNSVLQSLIHGCPSIESLVLYIVFIKFTELPLDLSRSPNLRDLDYRARFFPVFNPEIRLENAKFDLFIFRKETAEQDWGRTAGIMSKFLHAHTLSLGENFLKFFARDLDRNLWDRSNKFSNLTKLQVEGYFHDEGLATNILYLLSNSPCLQEIVFQASSVQGISLWGDPGSSVSYADPWTGRKGHLGSVKHAKILCFKEGHRSLGFARFVVTNAPMLETLIICDPFPEKVKEMLDGILLVEKISKALRIIFMRR